MSRGTQLDVTKLPIEQLAQLYKQVGVEMEALQRTLPLIQNAMNACQDSIESTKGLSLQKIKSEVLLPISDSAYAYGQVEEVSKVLIAIGGGFVAELTIDEAVKFFDSRLNNRKSELAKLRQALGQHQLTRDQIEIEIRSRPNPNQAQASQQVE
ncbi:Prefoldin_subunit [Hexamita inflata]|uniref:Prefoldin subunit n=1 Tax=Hexamita inflata TaxID=28002 RepID=A0AA86ULD5_9EUKA|nr:Prefoldin subunit [Hexamita inflata]